jgi:hypothetical protein
LKQVLAMMLAMLVMMLAMDEELARVLNKKRD